MKRNPGLHKVRDTERKINPLRKYHSRLCQRPDDPKRKARGAGSNLCPRLHATRKPRNAKLTFEEDFGREDFGGETHHGSKGALPRRANIF